MTEKLFAFVLLHYNEAEITKKSIASIRENTKGHAAAIVVVDNCSPDGSGDRLMKEFEPDPMVTVLKARENLGFAKGNNMGYAYAKDELRASFICVMNNDVLLIQPDFIDRIYREYESYAYGIIGPHITLLHGTNYMYLKLHSKAYFERALEESNRMYRYYSSKLYPVRNKINQLLDVIVPSFKLQKKQPESLDDQINQILAGRTAHKNIVLHGCCLIFTPAYLEKFSDAFDNRTFMFREEEMLYLRCRRKKIETIYQPSIDILHLEDMSTNATFKKDNKREAFKWKCQIDSLKLLLEELS